MAAVTAIAVVPLRTAREHLAANGRRGAHRYTSPTLLRGVDRPGGQPGTFGTGCFGVRRPLYFPDTAVGGEPDAVVTVSPPGTNPCGALAVTGPETWQPAGSDTAEVPVTTCVRTGAGAWTPSGPGSGATRCAAGACCCGCRRTTYGPATTSPRIAATLRPLSDHGLWTRLAGGPVWWWLGS